MCFLFVVSVYFLYFSQTLEGTSLKNVCMDVNSDRRPGPKLMNYE